MRRSSTSSSGRNSRQLAVGSWQKATVIPRRQFPVLLLTAYGLLLSGITGCESFQRKFTRKPNKPQAFPSPIINFQDYSQTMTPLDRYRKHYLMFDYWNGELIDALKSSPLNPKRFRRSSTESLTELDTLRGLLTEDLAAHLTPLLKERAKLDQQLQSGSLNPAVANRAWQLLEAQTRQIHRGFFWRDVEGHVTAATE